MGMNAVCMHIYFKLTSGGGSSILALLSLLRPDAMGVGLFGNSSTVLCTSQDYWQI